MKPWEEAWRWNGLSPRDVFGPDGGDIVAADFAMRHPESNEPGEQAAYAAASARLAAAAPEMARLLLRMRFESEDGSCIECGRYGDEHHERTCELATVLRKAGVLP